jgi:hypothetical protein
MAITDVTIVNSALVKVNAKEIDSLSDTTREARVANARFTDALDEVLVQAPWNFAIVRTQLAASDETPNHEWTYAHQLPTDPYCLQVLDVYEVDHYSIENRKILSQYTPLDIKYIKRVTNYSNLTPLFAETLATYLAIEFSYSLAGKPSLASVWRNHYERMLSKAKRLDAKESKQYQRWSGTWVSGRY